MAVRVRYAPSPTGVPHIGNIRTALFNWLFARHEGGTFIVRLEDTDRTRYVEGAERAIFDSLAWLGLDYDEGPDASDPSRDIGGLGPYVQSRRAETYRNHAAQLIEAGHAYRCYCTPERLDEVRKDMQRRKLPPKYDRHCRDLPEAERQRLQSRETLCVVRFKTPLSGQTDFHDIVRGDIVFENDTLDDFVLLKSDGFPVYHLANIVDDHLMGISHVLRGDEWLSSTPRHVLLYGAFGWEPPAFAHLPIILGPDRAKLSKRHGAASVLEFRDQGYLPEALFNFLGLLGWSLDDRTEIIDRETFVRHFNLDRVLASPAVFNREKLEWMNGVYIREMHQEDLVERAAPFLERTLGAPVDRKLLRRIIPLIRERITLLREIEDMADFFVDDSIDNRWDRWIDRKFPKDPKRAATVLNRIYKELSTLRKWELATIEKRVRTVASRLRFDKRVLFGLIRDAVTGRTVTPPLFESMWVLGRTKTLRRIKSAIDSLENPTMSMVEAPDEIRSATSPARHSKRVIGRKSRRAVTGETGAVNRTTTTSPSERLEETRTANPTIMPNLGPSSTVP